MAKEGCHDPKPSKGWLSMDVSGGRGPSCWYPAVLTTEQVFTYEDEEALCIHNALPYDGHSFGWHVDGLVSRNVNARSVQYGCGPWK